MTSGPNACGNQEEHAQIELCHNLLSISYAQPILRASLLQLQLSCIQAGSMLTVIMRNAFETFALLHSSKSRYDGNVYVHCRISGPAPDLMATSPPASAVVG